LNDYLLYELIRNKHTTTFVNQQNRLSKNFINVFLQWQ